GRWMSASAKTAFAAGAAACNSAAGLPWRSGRFRSIFWKELAMRSSLPVLLSAAIVMTALFVSTEADAQAAPQPRVLSVSGTGEVKATPDQAQLSTGVVTQAGTAAAAL